MMRAANFVAPRTMEVFDMYMSKKHNIIDPTTSSWTR